MKALDTNPEEVLRKAIQSEINSRELYLALAGKAPDATVSKRLRDIADVQLVHRVRLEKRYREVVGHEPPTPEPPAVELPNDAHTFDLRRVLKFALEHERDSESNYRFLAERVPGTDLGALFIELAEMEWRHKAELQNEYNAVGDPEAFLLDI